MSEVVEGQLLASAVQVDITPPIGTGMAGYAAREDVSHGIHDPLWAHLLLLKSDGHELLLICLDLLGVSLEFSQRVRVGIEQALGLPGCCTMVTCSHTHAGAAGFLPSFFGLRQPQDLELQRMVERKLIGAAQWARERLQPARLGVNRGFAEGIGMNRNDPEKGPVDNEVIVLRVDADEAHPLAVLMNYGCHPTVLSYRNLLFSADYPGAARAALRRIYPETVFMYTNGASGDVSTRFTRREQSFSEVERLGRILAGEVLKVMQIIDSQPMVELDARTASLSLDFRPLPSLSEAQRELDRLEDELQSLQSKGVSHGEIRQATTRVEGARAQVRMAEALAGRADTGSQVQILRIGNLALVGMPGEPFVRTVREIKEKSGHEYTAVVSYANDDKGYFPDASTVAAGTYEALISPYGADVAEKLRETALTLL